MMFERKQRGWVMRQLRGWLYQLVCEQAAIAGETALWVPTHPCTWCGQPVLSGSLFCASCGEVQADAVRTLPLPPPGGATQELVRHQAQGQAVTHFSFTGLMRAYRAKGEMPAKAYIESKKTEDRGGQG